MKIFLTGATGFIGSQLAQRLVSEGHEVAIAVRPGSNLDTLQSVLSQIRVCVYDGQCASLIQALKDTQPECVVHVASLFLSQHQTDDVARLVDSNINFPTQLLEAMRAQGVRHFINTGTSWQHYQNEAYNPVNLYAATKQAFEALLAYYTEAHGFKAITLKLFDTYGPGDTRPKLFSLLRKTARTGETLRMSPGDQPIDLVYIDDVLNAYLLAIARMARLTQPETYAISSLAPLSLKELVRVYSQTVGKPVSVEWGGLPYRAREVLTLWTNHQVVPGWQARMPLADGITRMEHDPRLAGLLVPPVA